MHSFQQPHYTAGTEILLIMGDFNETLGGLLQVIDSIVIKYNLLDLFPYHHGMDSHTTMEWMAKLQHSHED